MATKVYTPKSTSYGGFNIDQTWKKESNPTYTGGGGDIFYNPNDLSQAFKVERNSDIYSDINQYLSQYGANQLESDVAYAPHTSWGGMTSLEAQAEQQRLAGLSSQIQSGQISEQQGTQIANTPPPPIVPKSNTPNSGGITSSKGKSPLELTKSIQNSNYPKPGETIGDLFTNPYTNITYNWKTGAVVYDPKGTMGQSASTSSTAQTQQPITLPQGTFLKEGTYNNATVKQIQGILGVTADGDFGPKTKAAVIAFQKANGLTPDGIIGPLTLAALNKKSSTGASGGTNSTSTPTGTNVSTSPTAPQGGTPPPLGVNTSDPARAETLAQGIAEQKELLEQGLPEQPDPFDALAKLDELRETSGIVKDEEELNAIQSAMKMAMEELNQFKQTSGKEISQGGYLGGISEAERNLSFRMNDLALREQAVIGRINAKNSYINQAMQAGQQTYQNASTAYNNEYSKNLQAISLYNESLDNAQKDALTAFTTMGNLLSESGLAELTPQMSQQMDTLALQAGLPTGVFQTALKGISAKEKIDNIKVNGNNVYMWTTDAQGNPHLKLVQTISDGKPSGGTGNTPASYDEWSLAGGQKGTGKTYAQYLEGKGNDTESEKQSSAYATINQILALPTEQGYKDANGYLTAQGFKNLVSAALEDNISRANFLGEYAYLLYPNGGTAYGLTKKEMSDYGIKEK